MWAVLAASAQAAGGCPLTRASIDRCDQGPADEDGRSGVLTRVLQTTLDARDRRRHDFPPQLLAACCRQRHHTVNWDGDDNQSAFSAGQTCPELAFKRNPRALLLPRVGCVSLVPSVTPRITSSNESPSTSHSASGAEVTPGQNKTQVLGCGCDVTGKTGGIDYRRKPRIRAPASIQ